MEKKKIYAENETRKYQMRNRTITRISTFYWKIETKSPKMFFYFYQKWHTKNNLQCTTEGGKGKKQKVKKQCSSPKFKQQEFTVFYDFWYKCDNMENGIQNKYTNKIFLLNAIGCDLQCAQSSLLFIHFCGISNFINKVLLYWI